MEKVAVMAKKRDLKGNSTNSNSFSALQNDEIVNIYLEMGIIVENNAFDTFDVLRNLEQARKDLFIKQSNQNDNDAALQSNSNEGLDDSGTGMVIRRPFRTR